VLVLVALAAMLAGLTVLAILRPWFGLVLLLALLPFNGLLADVIGPTLHLSSNASTMVDAWHDALAAGIIAIAAWAWIRARPLRISAFETAVAVVLASGAISLILAPHLVTGLYAYRTLYEPICLAVALVALARERGLPGWVPSRAAAAIVLSGAVVALYSVWQVYVGGYSYLMTFEVRAGHLPTAYLASFVNQPRAFGTFHSPNEFGAFLALAIILVLSPVIVRLAPTARAWVAAALAFAQLLSWSRSSWVSLSVALVVLVALLPVTRSGLIGLVVELKKPRTWGRFAVPLATLVILAAIVVVGSGGFNLLRGTVSGQDPSSAEHASQLGALLPGVTVDQDGGSSGSSVTSSGSSVTSSGIFGLGLGAAGAKSTRFDSGTSGPLITSEVWYVDYALQTGYVGLIALFVLFCVVGRGLWKRRGHCLSRAALAISAGLIVGAFFIPVLDEPALAIPLWTLVGLGLTYPRSGSVAAEADKSHAAVEGAATVGGAGA
jgi:hypothetical protein